MLRQNPTILVVEDDPCLREAVCEFIQIIRPAWQTVEAANGQKGVELAQMVRPDLILSDLRMPVMNGYEMAIALQTQPETRTIPLIFNTSEDANGPLVTRLRTLCSEILFKPFLFDELESALERVFPALNGANHTAFSYAGTRHGGKVRLGKHRTWGMAHLSPGPAYPIKSYLQNCKQFV